MILIWVGREIDILSENGESWEALMMIVMRSLV